MTASSSTRGFERVAVSLVPAGVGAALLYAFLGGLGVGSLVSTCVSVASALTGAFWLAGHLPSDLDGALRRHTLWAVLWMVVGVGAIGATARLATFTTP